MFVSHVNRTTDFEPLWTLECPFKSVIMDVLANNTRIYVLSMKNEAGTSEIVTMS